MSMKGSEVHTQHHADLNQLLYLNQLVVLNQTLDLNQLLDSGPSFEKPQIIMCNSRM